MSGLWLFFTFGSRSDSSLLFPSSLPCVHFRRDVLKVAERDWTWDRLGLSVPPQLQVMVVVGLLSQPCSFLMGKFGFLGSFSFQPLFPAGSICACERYALSNKYISTTCKCITYMCIRIYIMQFRVQRCAHAYTKQLVWMFCEWVRSVYSPLQAYADVHAYVYKCPHKHTLFVRNHMNTWTTQSSYLVTKGGIFFHECLQAHTLTLY